MNRYPVTPEGYETLIADLKHHREVLRPRIVRDIEEARAHGDISENSEYEDAKERQALCEGMIVELENRISASEIIDILKLPENDRVVFGATVLIENSDSGEERRWRIVGEHEADIDGGKISYKSPLGKALIGKSEGDEATVPAPSGTQTWDIVEVKYR